jgi:hypothetical protein
MTYPSWVAQYHMQLQQNFKHKTFYTTMGNYFMLCKKINRQRFSRSPQSNDAYWPLSDAGIEEYRLPGVTILRCKCELCPLCQFTPVTN